MDRPIVDGRWRVHINGEGGMMGSVDYDCDGHERRLRAKRVMVVFNDTPMEEVSGVFFLTLLTSSSLCPHSLLWRKFLECSSSHCSLRHPCDLTHFVIPVPSLLWRKFLECSSSPCSLRYPCDLTPITCATTLSELIISLTSLSL